MYHNRFKKSHFEAGLLFGESLRKNNKKINNIHFFKITDERKEFAQKSINIYEKHFPEILEEIRGIAKGQNMSFIDLSTFLLSMYCFEFNNKCTCFAFKSDKNVIFGRNSDFLVEIEKLYTNCLYSLDNSYKFNGNTTAFVQMEDGVNEYGLAVGLTFIYPKIRKPGLNAGMLVRYLLEKCSCTNEALKSLENLPIASAQTITIADSSGDIVVVECNPNSYEIIKPKNNENFVVTANNFNSSKMIEYKNPSNIDDLFSTERYKSVYSALVENKNNYSVDFAKDILSGKYGFICQYDRKKGIDTVWSVIYDLTNKNIYRVEGNPSRKIFKQDFRLNFN